MNTEKASLDYDKSKIKSESKSRSVGDVVTYSEKLELRGVVKHQATIIQIYPALYHKSDDSTVPLLEMSIQYNDGVDICTVHGILLFDQSIS